MGNSTLLIDQIDVAVALPEITVNEVHDAMSPAAVFGRHGSACSGLTWAVYGGVIMVSSVPTQIANQTVTLTASATNYVEANSSGVVSVNTSAFTVGRTQLFTIITGSSAATSWTDHRTAGTGAGPGGSFLPLAGGTLTAAASVVYAAEYDAGNSGTSKTIDWANGQNQKLTLNGSPTLTISTPPGVGRFQLRIVEDGTGGHTITWAGSAYAATRWLGSTAAPTHNNAISGITIVTFYYDGTALYQGLSKVGAV